jgi:glycosyltransferase involved in cell wall biosynthesis
MRIFVLVTDAFGGHGGIARFNRDLLKALCAHPDCTEVVALPRIVSAVPGPLPEKLNYVADGVNHKFKYVLTALKTAFKNSNFDLIFCGHIHLLPLASFLQTWIQSPIVLVLYGVDVWKPVRRWLSYLFIKKVHSVISISEFTKQKFLEWASCRGISGYTLHPAIERNDYGAGLENGILRERYGLKGKKVMMTLGRLSAADQYKGLDEVLELMPELVEEVPNITYLIAGDGTDRTRLEKKAKSLGVSDRVIFTGHVLEAEKADHYRLADAFVMPGRGEGFGIVYLEAMACGVPVVASKADGSREALRNGELGILVDPDKPEEIKAGILEALKRPRGVVPDGLDYFSYSNFEKRCHEILNQIFKK